MAKTALEVMKNVFNLEEVKAYFEALPATIIHQVIAQSTDLYIEACQNSNEPNVSIIQHGQYDAHNRYLIPPLKILYAVEVSHNVTSLDFSSLLKLGTLSSGAFTEFHSALSSCLRATPKLQHLNLKSPNSRTSLPAMNGSHLAIMGSCNSELRYLDISFLPGLKNEELLQLVPTEENRGCPLLETLYVFDCGFSDKCIKTLVTELKNLKDVGYKEMGTVLKKLHKEGVTEPLNLSHINHLGGKARKTSVSSLRCKNAIIEAIRVLCPKVSNLKARVQDADVENLVALTNLTSVEFLYNVGRPTSPALGTCKFFQSQGHHLTSVALICSAISMIHIQTLGKNCPNLNSLWLRSNHFQVTGKGGRDKLPDDMQGNHGFFSKLRTLYFRVGEGELALTFVPPYVLPFMLRNAQSLKELKIALRSYIIYDDYICGLLIDCDLYQLEKLLIVVPGCNNLPGVIPLTMQTVNFVWDFCPRMKSLGNLLSWDVLKSEEFGALKRRIKDENLQIDLVCRHMVMH